MSASNSLLIKDVLLFTGYEFVENSFVVVQDGKIAQVGRGEPPSSEGLTATTISKPGHTLIPGLIDSHIHAIGGNVQAIEQPIRFGVTTVCDMHNEHEHNLALTKLTEDKNNKGKYADFKCAGLGATIEGGWPGAVVRKEFERMGHPEVAEKMISEWPKLTSPGEAPAYVKAQIESGASYIKLMHELGDTLALDLPRPSLDIQKAVVAAAHEHGVLAVGHAFSHAGALDLLQAGVDGLAHMFFDKPPTDDWVRIMKEGGVHCNPTLSLCASATGAGLAMQKRFAEDPLAKRMLFDGRPRGDMNMAQHCQHATVGNAYENTQALYRAGVPLIVGSDAAGQEVGSAYGLGVHVEMYQMVHAIGMKPADVLKSATSLIADRFGFKDRGKVEAGALGDLVLIEGDLRTSMLDEEVLCLPVRGVWREGVLAEVYQDAV
ncbi:hypothetical protein F4778DRAFT_552651 [Xylariomycetidae sp. FL2044]|nr:hypothetical protein F4778DRAFT_552651 [Xylariomycetidae sp. FL2044]